MIRISVSMDGCQRASGGSSSEALLLTTEEVLESNR